MVATAKVPAASCVYIGKFEPAVAPRTLVVFDPQSIAEPGSNYGFLSLVRSDDYGFEAEPTWEDASWQ
jgi:hypothetical protein